MRESGVNKWSRNKSSFSFAEFGQPEATSQEHIFRRKSQQMQECMTDSGVRARTQTKYYQDHIFNHIHKYVVPAPEQDTPPNQYHHFYSTHRKFTKPYGPLTKYSDTLNKNQSLLRRSQYDTPLHTHVPTYAASKRPRTKPSQSRACKTSQCLPSSQAHENTIESCFDKTIKTQYKVFRRLLVKERNSKKEKEQLNNSLNRLLAAEAISQQLKSKDTPK